MDTQMPDEALKIDDFVWIGTPEEEPACRWLVHRSGRTMGMIRFPVAGESFGYAVHFFGRAQERYYIGEEPAKKYALQVARVILISDDLYQEVAELEQRLGVLRTECERLDRHAQTVRNWLTVQGGTIQNTMTFAQQE